MGCYRSAYKALSRISGCCFGGSGYKGFANSLAVMLLGELP
jgi:hypothetical protein